jgi:hypothetical protein
MADVFLSYAHRNLRRVTSIAAAIEKAGLSLWWDKRLRAGDDFSLTIERQLNDAKCVAVAWSHAARASLWVRAEATEALDAGKLVQVRLDDVKPPLPFTIVETLDFTRWRDDPKRAPWPELEDRVRKLAKSGVQAVDDAVFTGPPLQDMGSWALPGWTSIGLVIFVSTLTLQLRSDGVDADLYGALTGASFAIACVMLALSLARIVRTALASARP